MSLYLTSAALLWFLAAMVIGGHGFLEVNLNGVVPANPQQSSSSPTERSSLYSASDLEPLSTIVPSLQLPSGIPPIISTRIPRVQCTEMKSPKLGEGQVMATEMCPAKMKHIIGKSVTDLRCQPRPEIVKLQLPGPNFDLHPSVAEVMRCNGFCGTPTSCLPTKISIKQVPVFTIDKARLHMFAQECAMVELEEHEECRCTCAVKASHCGPNQKYERGNCACVCMNHDVREECERNVDKMPPRQWDPITCTCRCVQSSMECASGLMWAPELCSSTPSSLLLSTTSSPLVNVSRTTSSGNQTGKAPTGITTTTPTTTLTRITTTTPTTTLTPTL